MSVFFDPDGTRWEAVPDPDAVGEPGIIYSGRDGVRVQRPMTADERASSDRHAEWYGQFMDTAERAWAGPITALREAGIDAHLWQTGGMCLAIGATFGDGYELMLTAENDVLSQTPDEHFFDEEDRDAAPDWFLGIGLTDDEGQEGTYWVFDGFQVTDRSQDADMAARVAAIVKRAETGCVACGTEDVGRFDEGRPFCRDCAGNTNSE